MRVAAGSAIAWMLLALANSEPTLARDDFSIVMGMQERAKDRRNVLVRIRSDILESDCCIAGWKEQSIEFDARGWFVQGEHWSPARTTLSLSPIR